MILIDDDVISSQLSTYVLPFLALPRRALAEAPAGAVRQVSFLSALGVDRWYLDVLGIFCQCRFHYFPLVSSLPKPYPYDHVCNFSMIVEYYVQFLHRHEYRRSRGHPTNFRRSVIVTDRYPPQAQKHGTLITSSTCACS